MSQALAKIEREVKISREKHEEQMMAIEEEMIAHRDAFEAEKRKGAHREKTFGELQRQLAAKSRAIASHLEEIDLVRAELVDTQSARDRIIAEKSQAEVRALATFRVIHASVNNSSVQQTDQSSRDEARITAKTEGNRRKGSCREE